MEAGGIYELTAEHPLRSATSTSIRFGNLKVPSPDMVWVYAFIVKIMLYDDFLHSTV